MMTVLGPALVYLLCLATSVACAILLARSYFRDRTRLLLWVSLGFIALAANNLLLVVDLLVLPTVDLWIWRQIVVAVSIGVLLYGFLWEVEP
ncbi:MAG: DUF5985 family protein [Caulobacterales bacterium]|jgi:hypothetical protein